MRRLIMTICCTTALIFHGAMAVAKDSSEELLDISGKLNGHSENLINLHESLSGIDQAVALELYAISSSASDQISFFSDLVFLHSVMVNSLDKASVQRTLKINKKFLSKRCDRDSGHITRQIAFAHSPAVVSEGEHLRDDLATACERVRTLK